MNQAERLARIETLLEDRVIPDIAVVREELAAIKTKELAEIKTKVDADVKDLAALKQRGGGILVGISLTAAAIGASLTNQWKQFLASLS